MSINEQEGNRYAHIGKNLITTGRNIRCGYDMMIRFPSDMIRFTSNPFTERGDRYEKNDPNKMLVYLIRYFVNKHVKERWVRVELYDNTKPPEDVERVILKYEQGEIKINMQKNYQSCFDLVRYTLPQFLGSINYDSTSNQ